MKKEFNKLGVGAALGEALVHELIMMSGTNDPEEVLQMLARSSVVTIPQSYLDRALCSAAGQGKPDIAKILIQHGANVNSRDEEGITPLSQAAYSKTAETTKLLISKGANVNSRGYLNQTPLITAAVYGVPDTIKELLKAGTDPKAKDRNGMTAYEWAKLTKKQENAEILEPVSAAPVMPARPRPKFIMSSGR